MPDDASADLPLAGIRVLDLSRVLAGPWCAMVLGDLGADVVKVEHPGRGDDTRDWGVRTGPTSTSYFDSVNRNKRSIGVDLATPEGLAIVRGLARESDVVVQNFKTGGADKLGLGYAALSAENPRLIYCSVSGYASDGPEATRPGYDLVVQGEAGLMALNGEAGRPPLKFGLAAVDLFTGQYAAQAVLAALFQRERTGRGRHVELALYDCGVALTSYYGLEALAQNADPPRYGNAHPSIVPYGVFEAGDGRWCSRSAPTRSSAASARRCWSGPTSAPIRASPPISTARATARPSSRSWRRSLPAGRARRCWRACAKRAFPAARCWACSRP